MDRQPCPERIFDDLGSAFAMGCVAGSIFHFVRGAKNAPRGERLRNAMSTMRLRGPILGGNFAVWGGCFSAVDCVMLWYRKKESPINSIVAGAITGGILAIRGGWKVCSRNAFIGGAFLALIEGSGIIISSAAQKAQELSARIPSPPKGNPIYDKNFRKSEFDFVPE